MKLIFLVLCCIFGIIFALDLPPYFSRCALSDPNLKLCAVSAANIVIPRLVKGDRALGVPVTDPVYLPKAELEGNNLKISLTDVYSYDMKKFRLTDASLDLENNKAGFTAVADNRTSFADYSISNGKVQNRTIFGRGKFNLTLVEPTLLYETDFNFHEKDGEKYVRLVNSTVKLTVNRVYFTFSGLQSSEKGQDINEFIYENWQALYAESKSPIERYLTAVVQSILNPITEKVPFTSIFTQ